MKKGISTIIAAIILVVITIGLIGTAYLYFAGIVRVGPVVSLTPPTCRWDDDLNQTNISISLKNEGTTGWTEGDLKFLWDGTTEVTPNTTDCLSVEAGETGTCVFVNGTGSMPADVSGTHTYTVIGPRNQATGSITC